MGSQDVHASQVVHNATVDEQQHQAVHDGHHQVRGPVHWWWTSAVKVRGQKSLQSVLEFGSFVRTPFQLPSMYFCCEAILKGPKPLTPAPLCFTACTSCWTAAGGLLAHDTH